jgi:transposase-like protein
MVTLSKLEQRKLEVVVKVVTGLMSRPKACQILECSERTLRRYLKDYQARDVLFVKHKNSNKRPHNKKADKEKEMALFLVKNKFYDFNILHLQEKLLDHGLDIKRETLRKWCHEIGMVKKAKRRRAHPRYKRQRYSQRGILIQMDGSTHQWFGSEKSCLIAAVDDATSEILYAEFYESESTFACLDFIKKVILKHGVFQNLYVDKAGVYGGVKRSELGTHVLYAHSPQAKGRIERLFNTLQDRLIPEMRINKVITTKFANEFLKEYLIGHNAKFGVLAANEVSAFGSYNKDLRTIFCVKELRQVASDHTVSFRGEKYLINERFKFSIHNQSIEIRCYEDEKWEAYFGEWPIKLIKIDQIQKNAA